MKIIGILLALVIWIIGSALIYLAVMAASDEKVFNPIVFCLCMIIVDKIYEHTFEA